MNNDKYPMFDAVTGEITPVLAHPLSDGVFFVHEDGGTLANVEVVVNAHGEPVLRVFVANPATCIEDEPGGFYVVDVPVASKGFTG